MSFQRPRPGADLQRFTLPITPDLVPQNVYGVGGPLMLPDQASSS